jgi:signal transduction histidine kinase
LTATVSRQRLTVQGWLNLVLSLMGMALLIGALTAVLLLIYTDRVSTELRERIQPARVAAYQLQAALRDQETAVRGYVMTADPQFLEPYVEGMRSEAAAVEEIRRLVGGRSEQAADLVAVERAAAGWRATYGEPMIAAVRPALPHPADQVAAERGKAEFDRIRGLFNTQNDRLTALRARSIAELSRAQTGRDGVMAALLLVLVATAILLALLVRNAVTRPLDALADACRRITEGNFDENIPPRGPRDIRAIGAAVEDMRQRIVAELDASRTARAQLAAQAEALDAQAVELRRSNAELEQFAYIASHDLQEPLRKVISFCQLLEKRYGDELDERGASYIAFAVDGARRMQVLINDLLSFSRVGRFNAAQTDVDLDTALDSALANLAIAIEESAAVIVRPEVRLPRVVGDATLLTMLWQNLIGNAIKFGGTGVAPRIVVAYRLSPADDGGEWLFHLSDNGIGIAEEFADKVFVIFQRLHSRDAYPGTGIGLALCKKIVEYHGGTIWIDSSYTPGTRFAFTLPAAPTEAVLVEEGTPG